MKLVVALAVGLGGGCSNADAPPDPVPVPRATVVTEVVSAAAAPRPASLVSADPWHEATPVPLETSTWSCTLRQRDGWRLLQCPVTAAGEASVTVTRGGRELDVFATTSPTEVSVMHRWPLQTPFVAQLTRGGESRSFTPDPPRLAP